MAIEKSVHLFDVIQVDNRDVRRLPLEERKKILHEILHDSGLEAESTHASTQEEILKLMEKVVSEKGEVSS